MAMDDFESGGEEELAAFDAAPAEEQEDDLFDFAGLNDVPDDALATNPSAPAPRSAVATQAPPAPPSAPSNPLDDLDFGDDLSAPSAPLPTANAAPAAPAISDPGLNEDVWKALDELQAQQDAVAGAAGRPTPVTPVRKSAAQPPQAVAPIAVGSAFLRLPPVVLLLLFVLVVVNSAVLLLGLRSQTAVQDLIVDVGRDVITSTEAMRNESAQARDTLLEEFGTPLVQPGPEGYASLARAEEALEAGDFRTARQALFALQAVRDRLDPISRDDVLARARFLIGQSYLQEARLRTKAGDEQ